jgi:Protein of unknown function (DUF1566)/Dockerin type I domain
MENKQIISMATYILSLILILTLTPGIYADILCGDANSDAAVNVSDAVHTINYVFVGGSEASPLCAADVNNDNSVNVSDAVYTINYVFVGGDAPDCPPDCDTNSSIITYTIVETGQIGCYDNTIEIVCPQSGDAFYGQDAQYFGVVFNFQDNGDGTVTDVNTSLMWQQSPDLYDKPTYAEAVAGVDTFSLAGHTDWRLPTIKELYSLIDFNGNVFTLTPYIDTDYFDFRFGDESLGERVIDAQYWSNTEYVGLTMGGDATVFGVNFADGRIKGYPRDIGPGGTYNTQFVRYVRGNTSYGINNFVNNGDSTITDLATGLMWQKADDGVTRSWEDALIYAENMTLAGYNNWRLPNAKELQSIVDYTHAPDAVDPDFEGPAIDSIFDTSEDESWFWTSTTHLDGPQPDFAVYVCFGQAFGYFGPPGMEDWINVHGAGAQRSDPKDGDPSDWPDGNGPQGDEVRIFNYIRCVRDAE